MRTKSTLLRRLAVLAPAAGAAGAGAQTFTGLGFLPGGAESQAWAVSADGSVVVGRSAGETGYFRAFRWDRQTGMMGLGVLPGALDSWGRGVNANGTVVVGQSTIPGSGQLAFRWSAATGMVALPIEPGGFAREAVGVSADGSIIVGNGGVPGSARHVGLRWAGGATTSLGVPPGEGSTVTCEGISGDGTHAVGSIWAGPIGSLTVPFQWTRATGMTGLPGLPGSEYSIAYGTNADGSVIVGFYDEEIGPIQAFRWTSQHGVQVLGELSPGAGAAARGVSADGGVVVGTSINRAMMWTATLGMVDLNLYLPSIGIDLSGWTLSYAMAVSADGLTIVGNGVHNGLTEAWAATLGSGCYANCDRSTAAPVLNILDFMCFLNSFAAGSPYANCDGSTAEPVLNVLDFTCFLNMVAGGCP